MPTVVDIFAGAGGISQGFQEAGFDVALSVDSDPVACETFAKNHPRTWVVCDQVEKLSWAAMVRDLGRPIDVVIGGPSCQGFSTHGKRDPNDPRNFLFAQFVKAVATIRPSWVVMENVKGLLTYDKGRYREEIVRAFRRIGYDVEVQTLLAANYGVPQLRERLFFLATNTGMSIDFPAPTHAPADIAPLLGLRPFVTVDEALGDLPYVGEQGEATAYSTLPATDFQRYVRDGSESLTLHRAQRVSDFAMKIIRQIPPGNGIRYLPESKLPRRFRQMRKISSGKLRRDCTTLYYRLRPDRPAYTITCYFTNVSSGPFVHPREDRALTPREAARLQSFKDTYAFVDAQLTRQIGNAVPPTLARAVALHLAEKLSMARGARRSRRGVADLNRQSIE
jgi:DNA (cytosine-5)-methyltransferase 1